MVQYKKKYKDVIVGVNGFGNVNTSKVSAETVKQLSKTYKGLNKLIEEVTNEKKSKGKD